MLLRAGAELGQRESCLRPYRVILVFESADEDFHSNIRIQLVNPIYRSMSDRGNRICKRIFQKFWDMSAADDVIATLSELKEFLLRYEVSWALNVDEVLRIAAWNREYELKNTVTAMFGGMGSLNDIYICRVNGHNVQDEAAANAELDRLRGKLWSSAQRL